MKESDKLQSYISDTLARYKRFRSIGKSRNEAISLVKEEFSEELEDDDDRVSVLIGLSHALCQKQELTSFIAQETICEINRVLETSNIDSITQKVYYDMLRMLHDKSMQGEEAFYRRRLPYKPQWEIGDLFTHSISIPNAVSIGIIGWSILFYKVGEHLDTTGNYRHLMYVSLCPPGTEPASSLQLSELGFLRMMPHGDKWDYMVQVTPKSKQDELNYHLTKIGNYKNVILPSDRTEENPVVAMPMYGCLKKGDTIPFFEEQICRLYKRFGKYLNHSKIGP